MSLVRRDEKVAFLGKTASDGETVYNRMKNFTEITTSKNPVEYERRYVDEKFSRTDVTGYSDSISYNFDLDSENPAHTTIVSITDNEMTGDGAVVEIVLVDMTKEAAPGNGTYKAKRRKFTVVPDSEGDSTDAYTYSGTLKANGETEWGTAATTDSWETCSFMADTEE